MESFMIYTLWQWLLFFYIYSFIGWIWECCYVSVQKHRWVNRGFLNGPFLPIYGCGALAVLISTIPVRDNVVLIFIFGMTGATILEYFTGWGMEKLFKVKYWDYSRQPFNLNGYICPMASIGWGLFSVAMIKGIHIPVEYAVLALHPVAGEGAAFIFTAYMGVDTAFSFRAAMDMRDILEKLQESKDYIRRMQKRLDVLSAVAADEYQQYLVQREEKKSNRRERFAENLAALREAKERLLEELWSKTEAMREAGAGLLDLQELRDGIRAERLRMSERGTKEFKRIAKVLRRNPKAISKKYQEVLDDIKKLL